eukprot:4988177-Pyramimonas_sp.AAC.1
MPLVAQVIVRAFSDGARRRAAVGERARAPRGIPACPQCESSHVGLETNMEPLRRRIRFKLACRGACLF